jgi:ABC-type Zn uptake system ZnuABC Zn-binding protein ZnuA
MGLSIILTACAGKNNAGKGEVLTSFYPIQIFTMNITEGIPELAPKLMIPCTLGCPHEYSMTPGDMEKIRSAKVLIINGLMESSFISPEKIKALNPSVTLIDSGKEAVLIPLEEEEGHHHDGNTHEEEHHHGKYNPHLWVSPFVAAVQVRVIGRELSALYPKHSEKLLKNAENYAMKLEAMGETMKKEIAKFPNKKIIAFHEAFDYFARDLGLDVVGVLEIEPGVNPGPKHLKEMANLAKKYNLKAVFAEAQYPADIAEMVAKEAGIRLLILDPAASAAKIEPGMYEEIMVKNMSALKEALQ